MKLDILAEARTVFDKEIQALEKTKAALGADFEKIAELILHCRGKVIITGMGKPGHIGTKIAATLQVWARPRSLCIPPRQCTATWAWWKARML